MWDGSCADVGNYELRTADRTITARASLSFFFQEPCPHEIEFGWSDNPPPPLPPPSPFALDDGVCRACGGGTATEGQREPVLGRKAWSSATRWLKG